ncbi:MAG: hypothetical protein MOB07_06755 [Acidobacteria bacterium]|nr:hypothetical protein [Acidobacteriota bacterium]
MPGVFGIEVDCVVEEICFNTLAPFVFFFALFVDLFLMSGHILKSDLIAKGKKEAKKAKRAKRAKRPDFLPFLPFLPFLFPLGTPSKDAHFVYVS